MIKRKIKNIFFIIKYAYKNILHDKLKSISFVFSFFFLNIIIFLGLLISPIIRENFYQRQYNTYNDINLIIDTNENSDSRFFSITPLLNDPLFEENINYTSSFFEIVSLTSNNNDQVYSDVLLSNTIELEKILKEDLSTVNNDETIITTSLSKELNVKKDEYINILIGEANKQFKIIEIIEDKYVFSNNKMLINKQDNITSFLEVIEPSLSEVNPLILQNIYNKTYIDLKTSPEEGRLYINSFTQYQSVEVLPSINADKTDFMIHKYSSIFYLVFFITLFFVLISFISNLILFYKQRKQIIETNKYLGAGKSFNFFVLLVEKTIILFISFIFSSIFIFFLIKYSLNLFDFKLIFTIPITYFILNFVISFLTAFLSLFIYINYFPKNNKKQKKVSNFNYLLISTIFAIFYLFLHFIFKNNIDFYYLSVIKIILLLISFLFLLIFIINIVIIKFKKDLFYLNSKVITKRKEFKYYNIILFICFVSIFILIGSRTYLKDSVEEFKDEVKIDYILKNIRSNIEIIENEIDQKDNVQNVSKVNMYSDVYLNEYKHNIRYFISMGNDDVNSYFNLDIKSNDLDSLYASEEPSIMLPYKFYYLFKLEKGDYIEINFYKEFSEEFKIIGFFNKMDDDLIISNINSLAEYSSLEENTILIKSNGDQNLKSELLEEYKSSFIYVIDYNESINKLIENIKITIDFILLILLVILLSLLFSISNYNKLLFLSLKKDFKMLNTLGEGKKILSKYVLFIFLFFFVVIILLSFLFSILLEKELTFLLLLFKEYRNINFSNLAFIQSFTVIFGLYLIVVFSFIYKIKKIKIIN